MSLFSPSPRRSTTAADGLREPQSHDLLSNKGSTPAKADPVLVAPPTGPNEPLHRFLLSIIRRMALFGIDDAQAMMLLFNSFGQNHRRPLILLRAMMLELSRASHRKILLAPPCCGRMTRDEALILKALGRGPADLSGRHADACALLAREDAIGPATCFDAVAQCFADLGYPLD